MTLSHVYHYDGVTKSDIAASVIKLSATRGAYPDVGGLSIKLTYPVIDSSGSEVTLEKGDLIWPEVINGALTNVPAAGTVADIKRDGDIIEVTVESLIAPLMRMRYTIDDTLVWMWDILGDVLSGYTTPFGVVAESYVVPVRYAPGSEVPMSGSEIEGLVDGGELDVYALFQYLMEMRPVYLFSSTTGVIFPHHTLDSGTGLPKLRIGYSPYGNYENVEMPLSHDAGVLSNIEWGDSNESILNDITIKVRGGGSVHLSDATSIAAYGKRETVMNRGLYDAGSEVSPGAAYKSAEVILAAMKDPHRRCKLTCDADYMYTGKIGMNYRVIDAVTGTDQNMILRSFTYKYPEEVCECVFDNAPLDMSKYSLRLENRVASLEDQMVTAHAGFFDLQGGVSPNQYYHLSQAAYNNLYQQDQGVKTTDSPTFASPTFNTINISGSYNQIRAPLKVAFRNADNSAYMGLATKEIYIGDYLFVNENRDITCGSITPRSINVHDLGSQTQYWNECFVASGQFTSLRSMDIVSVDPCIQVAQGASHIWLRFRMSGASLKSGALFSSYDSQHFFMYSSGGDLKIDHNTTLDSAGAVNKLTLSNGGSLTITGDYYGGRLYLTSSAHSTDMGVINNTSPTSSDRVNLSINRTNQSGTMLYLSIYDAKNGSFGGVMLKGLRLTGTANCNLSSLDNGLLNVQTSYGWLKMGPNNGTWCHFYTDMSKYYFNRGLDVTGPVIPYSSNTYDLGSYAQKWRDLYLGGSCAIDQNLTVFGDVIGSGVVVASAMATRTISASSTVQYNNATYQSTTTTSSPGTVVKRLKVNYAMTGTFYIKWSLVSQGTGITVYGRLYKNGSTLGSQRSTSSGTGVTFTEGPFTNIAAGDEFQIYARTADPLGAAGVWDMQICFTPSTVLPLYTASI